MPHLHHRRRHSWPYSGPRKQPLPIIKVSAPDDELAPPFLTPLAPEDLFDDPDAASAGIVRSPNPHHHHHLWSHFRTAPTDKTPHLSGSTGPPGTFRRMIRPPLDKARSLFTVPTTTATGESVWVAYWVQQGKGGLSRGTERTTGTGMGTGRVERYHRRCHSEQPRSWREPSASLWTLLEE
ncbi:hypothetical protein HFD88_002734 [Aspergillus terreus]|nr:hypothetical protein HFD88_002734 [Aspergillus terreus]